jgi:hypothetical protein
MGLSIDYTTSASGATYRQFPLSFRFHSMKSTIYPETVRYLDEECLQNITSKLGSAYTDFS